MEREHGTWRQLSDEELTLRLAQVREAQRLLGEE